MRTAAVAVLCLALGLAGGSAAGGAWEGHLRAQLAAAQAALLEAQERAGAGCEPIWMAAYWDGDCRPALNGWKPTAACEARCTVYRHPDPERVRARLYAVGPRLGVTLYKEQGAKEQLVPIRWNPEVPK